MLMDAMLMLQHVTTTDVYYYLAFKIKGQQNMTVAYQSTLPRLAVLQPVYQRLLKDLTPGNVSDTNAPHTKPHTQ